MDLKSISRLDKASGNFGRMPYRISNGEYLFEAFVDTLKENVMTGKLALSSLEIDFKSMSPDLHHYISQQSEKLKLLETRFKKMRQKPVNQ
jgi:hypothetical protein